MLDRWRSVIRFLVTQALWMNEKRLPVLATIALAIQVILGSWFWLTSAMLIQEVEALMQNPTADGASDIVFVYFPIAFSAGCYLLTYMKLLQTILLLVLRYFVQLAVLLLSIISIPLAVQWLFFRSPPDAWMAAQVCACAHEYQQYEDYQKLIAKLPLVGADTVMRVIYLLCVEKN